MESKVPYNHIYCITVNCKQYRRYKIDEEINKTSHIKIFNIQKTQNAKTISKKINKDHEKIFAAKKNMRLFQQLNSSITKLVHKYVNIKEEYSLLQSMRTLKTTVNLFLFILML